MGSKPREPINAPYQSQNNRAREELSGSNQTATQRRMGKWKPNQIVYPQKSAQRLPKRNPNFPPIWPAKIPTVRRNSAKTNPQRSATPAAGWAIFPHMSGAEVQIIGTARKSVNKKQKTQKMAESGTTQQPRKTRARIERSAAYHPVSSPETLAPLIAPVIPYWRLPGKSSKSACAKKVPPQYVEIWDRSPQRLDKFRNSRIPACRRLQLRDAQIGMRNFPDSDAKL